jgi:hypothetical protein
MPDPVARKGRVTVHDRINELEIIIPAKKHYFIAAFLCLWLCGWAAGEASALGTLMNGAFNNLFTGIFMLVWITGWTFGGGAAFFFLCAMLFGRETIIVNAASIAITEEILVWRRARSYRISETHHFRLLSRQAEPEKTQKACAFTSGNEEVEFGSDLSPSEAHFLYETMSGSRLLKEITSQRQENEGEESGEEVEIDEEVIMENDRVISRKYLR